MPSIYEKSFRILSNNRREALKMYRNIIFLRQYEFEINNKRIGIGSNISTNKNRISVKLLKLSKRKSCSLGRCWDDILLIIFRPRIDFGLI